MENLEGNNLQIKLSIKEGKNFSSIQQPTIIVGTLNNHCLETDLVQPEESPQFCTDLVWEAERKSLRKLRTNQIPLKVQCFALTENGAREKIGYILLSLRSAQIVPKSKIEETKMTWHPILGLKNSFKGPKPELLISLTIEDSENPPNSAKTPKENQHIIPVILEERFIQLGPINKCEEIFLFNITASVLSNVESFMENKQNKSKNQCSLWYNFMGTEIQSKPIQTSSEKSWILNEKIVVKIKSSLSILQNYFEKNPSLNIILKSQDEILARTKVDVRPLVCVDFPENMENLWTTLERQCVFVREKATNAQDSKPCLSMKLKFQVAESQNLEFGMFRENGTENREIMNCPNILNHRNPSGDSEKMASQFYFARDDDFSCEEDLSKSIEMFHCYCLNISLTGVKLLESCNPEFRTIEFRFVHPKSENVSEHCPKILIPSGEKARLQNVGCKLHLVSSAMAIKNLLSIYPPRVTIYDAVTKSFLAQTMFDVQKLFNQKKPECEYEAFMIDQKQAQIGTLNAKMSLEDKGLYYKNNKKYPGENLGPPILDDNLAFKIIDELETWKEKQMEIFRFELKRKEELHLNFLCEEFQKKKETLESQLAASMEKCKILANDLNRATDDLRMRRLKSMEKETRLIKAKEDMQNQYESKLQDYRNAAESMKKDLLSKSIFLEDREKSLALQVDMLRAENELLRCSVKQQAEKLQQFDEGSAKEEIKSMGREIEDLTGKLESARRKKTFFQEKWSECIKEMQSMKNEQQQAIELQIKNSREELQNLDLEEILFAGSEALGNDKILLSQIQREVETMGPISGQNSERKMYSTRSLRQENFLTPEIEERLKTLVNERDLLLKTTSYTNNDEIIMRLNDEIKLLTNQ